MQTMILQFKHQKAKPTLENVCSLFHLNADEVDSEYGVVAIDRGNRLYSVLVDSNASERILEVLNSRGKDSAEGLFANPRIEPFGPPKA